MKQFIIAVITICLLSVCAYAEDDYKCDYKYHRAIKKVNSLSNTELSKEDKEKWISSLKEIHRLCEDGKDQEAAAIMQELREDRAHDMVFNPATGH